MNRRAITVATGVLAAVLVHPLAAVAAPCDDLVKLALPGTTVTSVAAVAAGAFVPPGAPARGNAVNTYAKLPAFCRAMATARPSPDSDLKIEVWLPAAGWNGRLQVVGQGGLAGSIPYGEMAAGLAAGYATAGTDTGHAGGTADFMPGHPEKLIDFAYRSIHEVAVVAKGAIRAYYGSAPTQSYFNGCSGAGRLGLASVQKYPDDFRGVIVGSSSWNQARLDAARIGVNLTVNRTPESKIPASKYPMVHNAVLTACDALDGVKDGVLENPTKCPFDYASLACKGPDGPNCLTAPQVASAKVLTSPLRNEATGAVILEPHLWPGSELEWGTLGGPEPLSNSVTRVRNFHLKDPKYEFRLANIASDVERAGKMDGGILETADFNLKPFFDRGGKLIMYHGWGDPQVPGHQSILFYNNVVKTVGPDAATSIALFMVPGMLHCGGGPGTDTFDKMAPLTQWVEKGTRPARIPASHFTNGQVDKTRPLCPFGEVAKYKGTGNTNEAANFSCAAEAVNLGSR